MASKAMTKPEAKPARKIIIGVPIDPEQRDVLEEISGQNGEISLPALVRIFIGQGIARWRADGKLNI